MGEYLASTKYIVGTANEYENFQIPTARKYLGFLMNGFSICNLWIFDGGPNKNTLVRVRMAASGVLSDYPTQPVELLESGSTQISGTHTSTGTALVGTGSNYDGADGQLGVGSRVQAPGGQVRTIVTITDETNAVLDAAFVPDLAASTLQRIDEGLFVRINTSDVTNAPEAMVRYS